jgi:hypothetical protein
MGRHSSGTRVDYMGVNRMTVGVSAGRERGSWT